MLRLLLALIRLLPDPFRTRFGAEIADQVRAEWDEARRRGRWSLLRFTGATAFDLVRTAVQERLAPSGAAGRRQGADEYRDRLNAGEATTRTTGGDGMIGQVRTLLQDATRTLRTLGSAPGFTLTTVGTLGLAIGVTAAIFTVVDAVLLDPLPFPDADRLVEISASAPGSDVEGEFGVSSEFLLQYREVDGIEDAAIYDSFTNTMRTDERVERIRMAITTPSLFSTLGVAPAEGRLPRADEEGATVVISDWLWREWFGADPDVLGRSYWIGGDTRTIVGVMDADFGFPSAEGRVDVWIPAPVRADGAQPGAWGMGLVARVAPGTDRDALTTRLEAAARGLPDRFGGSTAYAQIIERHRPVVRSLREEMLGPIAAPLWILFAAMAIVLAIACANVTNLFLVRAERRLRAAAVRRALGATRGRLARLQLTETGLVSVLAGLLAVGLVVAALPSMVALLPPEVTRIADVQVTVVTIAFAFGVSVLVGVACGVGPALRTAGVTLDRIGNGARGSTVRRHRLRDTLVAGQTALALVLVVGSGLLLRSFVALTNVDPGYETEDLFTFQIAPEREDLTDGPSLARFHLDFMERLRAMPGVERVGIVENLPLQEGYAIARGVSEADVEREGPDAVGRVLGVTVAAGDYFEAMGIEVLRGRAFTEAEHLENPGHVIVSRAAAEQFWPGEDPIGKRVRTTTRDDWETVIGMVEDVMQYDFRTASEPLMYYPLVSQNPADWTIGSPAYVVETPRADRIGPEIRALVREVDPRAPMYRVFTMEELAKASTSRLTVTLLVLASAAGLSLVLGMVGLYGVLSSVVAERTREIGVRMALGADRGRVRRMVVRQGVRVVTVGIALGLVTALLATRALESLLFGVDTVDPWTLAGTVALMLLVGAAASWIPARRASAVDPTESLAAG